MRNENTYTYTRSKREYILLFGVDSVSYDIFPFLLARGFLHPVLLIQDLLLCFVLFEDSVVRRLFLATSLQLYSDQFGVGFGAETLGSLDWCAECSVDDELW